MADLEKVIRGLECCLNTGNFEECTENCRYFTKKLGVGVCSENMMRDALSLLKAQKPRVMTLEEAKALPFGTDIWIEYLNIFNDTITYAATIRHNESSILVLHPADVVYRWGDYGRAFVIWTGHPTEKQQKVVKWE